MRPVASIRRRLVAPLLAGMLAVSCATVGFVYWYLREEIVEQYDLALLSKARALTGVVGSDSNGNPTFLLPVEAMPEYHRQPRDTDYFQIWRPDGSVLARSPSLGAGDLPGIEAASYASEYGFIDARLPGGRMGRAAWLHLHPSANAAASPPNPTKSPAERDMLVAVATSGEEFDETIGHLVFALVTASVTMSAGTLLVVLAAVNRGLRPLREVAETAGRIDAGSLDYRFEIMSLPAELRPIADRLNTLLGRLEEAFQRERRFTANVAHELRTPIAELRASAEVAMKWSDDHALTIKGLRDSLAVAGRMEAVVESLLSLVRGESNRATAKAESVDLAQAASDAWRPYAGIAAKRRLKVRFEIPCKTRILADRTLLGSLVSNLASNAVAYSPEGGQVVLRCGRERGRSMFVIENSNIDLTQADLPQLTEPFWRKDASRTDATHVGLGLAIAQTYAIAMDASLRFALQNECFSASVTFPHHPLCDSDMTDL